MEGHHRAIVLFTEDSVGCHDESDEYVEQEQVESHKDQEVNDLDDELVKRFGFDVRFQVLNV
jgi:hypothetical protein